MIANTLARHSIDCIEERDGIAAWNRFLRTAPSALLTAVDLPGLHGRELLSRVRERATTPFVFHSTVNDIPAAVSAIQSGADDFVVIPDRVAEIPDRLRSLVERHSRLSARAKIDATVVGISTAILRVKEKLQGVAGLRIPVLVRGEEGSGRDHVVRALVAADAIGPGQFTIIRSRSPRQPARSDGGMTVYLDGIERFSVATQAQWLEQVIRSENGDENAPHRILASTACDLLEVASTGTFDSGLAERLSRFAIDLPPLRERLEDISLLARHMTSEIATRMGRSRVVVTPSAIRLLRTRAWRGNIRELAAILERLVAFSIDGLITRQTVGSVLREAPSSVVAMRRLEDQRQRDQLVELLNATGGNLAEVARRLEMSRGAVIYRAQKFGLLPKRF